MVDSENRLARKFGLSSSTAIVISSMIGTGIFTTTGFLAGDLGSAGLILAIWAAGAASALLGSLCYAELGVNLAESGGEYIYLREAWGSVWAFLSGWVSFFAGFSAPIAVATLAFAEYVGQAAPALAGIQGTTWLDIGSGAIRIGPVQLVAALLVVILTVLCLSGVRLSASAQNTLTAIKLVILVLFVVLAFTIGNGDWRHFALGTARTSSTPIPRQFAISLFYIYLSYSGWNAATYVAGEIRNPEKTLPRALFGGTALVTAFYLLLNIVFIYGAPLTALKGQVAVGAITASHLFGSGVGHAFAALMALSLVASVNAQTITGPRVYFAMAADGAFFAPAARIHSRFGTPWIAILAQGACTLLMIVTPLPDLLQYIGFTLSVFTALGVGSLFVLRRRAGWRRLPAVSFAWPLIPALFLLPELWIVFWGAQLRPVITLWTTVTIAAGAVVYALSCRLRSVSD